MQRKKANISICFKDRKGEEYFLLQVLNVGSKKDELKFVFNDPETNTGTVYNETTGVLGDNDIVHPRPEISYHSDGTMMWKMVAHPSDPRTVHKNPLGTGKRRTPLSGITSWEPIIRYQVVDYTLCRKLLPTTPIFLPAKPKLFDGTPFECRILLGSKDNPTPIDNDVTLGLRICDFADAVDILLVIGKSQFAGQHLKVGKLAQQVWSRNNLIEFIERVQ